MERPWLILHRVLHVVQPVAGNMHAGAEEDAAVGEADQGAHAHQQEHAVAGEAEENPQAQQQEHAAVGEAEDDPQAQQDQQAAVGEAEDDPQPQAQQNQQAAVGEAEDDPQAQLLESVVHVNTNAEASAAAHAGAVKEFVILVAPPPRVSLIVVGLGSHADMYPYIIASGRFCLLVHFATGPSYGTNFNMNPDNSHLVVVRHFRREDGHIAARAVDVPARPDDMFALRYIESVGLTCNEDTGHCKIAEIMVSRGSAGVLLFYINTQFGIWQRNVLESPLNAVDRDREWVPHGTIAINSTVVWFDLSWGMISCDLDQPQQQQVLVFHRLPGGHAIRRGGATPDVHCRRCIAVSQNLVRYVEIALYPHDPATVTMWYRDVEGVALKWFKNYEVKFENIWDDASYIATGLPRNPPVLVGVSPVNCNVVYFALKQQLVGVNVPEHRVVHFENEPRKGPGRRDEPISSRYLIAWNLEADVAFNLGHVQQPMDHLDEEGSSSDDSCMDYQSPRKGPVADRIHER